VRRNAVAPVLVCIFLVVWGFSYQLNGQMYGTDQLSKTTQLTLNDESIENLVRSGGTSDPDWLPPITKMTGDQPVEVAIGDVNNDGVNDIVTADMYSGGVSIFSCSRKRDVTSGALLAETHSTNEVFCRCQALKSEKF
jgi:hypothetical protein